MPLDATPQTESLSIAKQREAWWLAEDRIEQLSVYWDMGLTCQLIADKLGTSKNSVIGKARRLGLAMRTEGKATPLNQAERLANLNVLIASGGCRWPKGEPERTETFSYCGQPQHENKSYCLHHFVESINWEQTNRAGIRSRRPECDCKTCKRKHGKRS